MMFRLNLREERELCVSRSMMGELSAALAVLLCMSASWLLGSDFARAAEACPNAASRQGASVDLPDCRAYEQVTPVNKGDATDLFSRGRENPDRGYPAEDGESFLLGAGFANFASGVSGDNTYVFSRQTDGWTTTSFAPPAAGVQSISPAVYDLSNDFARIGVVDQIGSEPAKFISEGASVTSVIGAAGGPYETVESEPFVGGEHMTSLVGASAGLRTAVLEGRNHELVTADQSQDPESNVLYEWRPSGSDGCDASSSSYSLSAGGCVEIVNVDSADALVSPCGAVLGQGIPVPGYAHGAVSNDGSKIVFTAPDPEGSGSGCWSGPTTNAPQIYMRINRATTVQISAPNQGVNDPYGAQAAVYVGASRDDSRVFFMSPTELTSDDATHAPELYEYDAGAPEGSRLTRISRGQSGAAEGNVDFVAAISNDGSAVYFAAFGELVPGLPPLEEEQAYLYRYDTQSGQTAYIARIGAVDFPSNAINVWYSGTVFSPFGRAREIGMDTRANWFTTGDGRYLVFAAKQSLTGYDNKEASGANCESLSGTGGEAGTCTEVYLYDGRDGSLACVSCGPQGVPQVDNARFARSAYTGGAGTANPVGTPPRPISEDGEYVFFDTANTLVPQAANGNVHVYEWHEGAISLISSVSDPGNAYFLGSNGNGHDVFFGTHAQLSARDTDVSGDLYDARVDGGFASIARPICSGTGCQGSPSPPPVFTNPASVVFEGTGNFSNRSMRPAKLTRAQRFARALKACRSKHSRTRRARCESRVKKEYRRTHRAKSNRRGK